MPRARDYAHYVTLLIQHTLPFDEVESQTYIPLIPLHCTDVWSKPLHCRMRQLNCSRAPPGAVSHRLRTRICFHLDEVCTAQWSTQMPECLSEGDLACS